MHYEPNPEALIYLDTKFEYNAPKSFVGGPFTSKMKFKAGPNELVAELRLAYARSWEFDFELLKTSNSYLSNRKAWNSKLVTVEIKGNVQKIDLTGINNLESYKETVQAKVGDWIRVTLKETPLSGYHWFIQGNENGADSPI